MCFFVLLSVLLLFFIGVELDHSRNLLGYPKIKNEMESSIIKQIRENAPLIVAYLLIMVIADTTKKPEIGRIGHYSIFCLAAILGFYNIYNQYRITKKWEIRWIMSIVILFIVCTWFFLK